MKRAAFYVISPIHLIAQLTAFKSLHPEGGTEIDVLVYWPGASAEMLRDLEAIFRLMTSNSPEIAGVVAVSQSVLDEAMAEPELGAKYNRLQSAFKLPAYDEIYFPHDVVGTLYQLLATGNPDARRITTGENLGHVFDRDVYYSYFNPAETLWDRLRRLLNPARKPVASGAPNMGVPDFKPHMAALLLPVDQSGSYLHDMEFFVPPREIAITVLEECRKGCADLNSYIDRLLSESEGRKRYILCMQNFAECGTIDINADVGMWADIVRTYCVPGATVFLKTHPAEALPRTRMLEEALSADYAVVTLEQSFRRFPIELWANLAKASTVISSSMPALSLHYFYATQCIFPFIDALIEKWFPQKVWRFYKNGAELFSEPLRRYRSWDSKSVLWSGKMVP